MRDFFHIHIVPREGVTRADIERQINKGMDWFRYGDGLYMVYTRSDAAKWKARLIDLVKPNGSLLIVKVDIFERKGFMSPKFWNWINNILANPK